MRRLLALLLMLICLSACAEAAFPAAEMDAYAACRFQARDVVGGAVIIARNGEILYGYAYGHKNASRTWPVTLDTCFHAASVTKMVSAIGLMHLLEEKDIPLETPVKEIVGFPVVNPAFPEADITIRQVLSHTSSIKETQYLKPNWEALRVENRYFSVRKAPGTAYEYSNLNGGLIGAMIEALSGQSINTYMQEQVFVPLGINAAYHAALLPDQSDISAKLKKNGTIYRSAAKELETFHEYDDSVNPRAHTNITSGGLYISPNGLIRIAMLLENGGELDGVRLLREETVQLMMAEQHLVPGSSVRAESPYGLCINRVQDMPGGTWYGHQGRWQGLSSNVYFQPETGLCIIVFANGYSPQTIDGVASIARAFMEKAQEFIP